MGSCGSGCRGNLIIPLTPVLSARGLSAFRAYGKFPLNDVDVDWKRLPILPQCFFEPETVRRVDFDPVLEYVDFGHYPKPHLRHCPTGFSLRLHQLPIGGFHGLDTAPVHLRLPPGCRLEAHDCVRLPTAAARRHVALQGGVCAAIAHCLELTVQYHAVFQPLGQALLDIAAILVLLSLSKGSTPAALGAWDSWTQGISCTGEPCCGRRPGLRQSPGSSGPPLSSRRSLSLLAPSAKSSGTSTKSS